MNVDKKTLRVSFPSKNLNGGEGTKSVSDGLGDTC